MEKPTSTPGAVITPEQMAQIEQQKRRDDKWKKGIQALVESELQTAACRVQLTIPLLDEEQFVQSARIAWQRAKLLGTLNE